MALQQPLSLSLHFVVNVVPTALSDWLHFLSSNPSTVKATEPHADSEAHGQTKAVAPVSELIFKVSKISEVIDIKILHTEVSKSPQLYYLFFDKKHAQSPSYTAVTKNARRMHFVAVIYSYL